MSVQVQHRRDTTANIEAVIPAVAELGYDTTKKEALIGDGATSGGLRLPKKNIREILIAAQITSNQNDYSPTGLKHAKKLIVSTDASRNITGIAPTTVTDATDGRELEIYNGGSFNVVLQDQNASSSAANRLDLGGADITLAPKQSLTLIYRTQGTLNRWEISARTDGQTPADGAISARKLAASAMGFAMINGTLVPSVAGSALTVAIKTLAGNDPSSTDPVFVVFRNATAATGDFVVMTLTAATSLVLSNGSAIGMTSNVAFRIWIAGFNDAGTFRLGAINCRSGSDIMPLAAWDIASSTAEGGAGAADNAQTFYTGTAVTAKAYALLGYMTWETGLGSAGVWSAGPTRSQLFGLGVPLPGQQVQSVIATDGSANAVTTVLPADDTIPQNTEGTQLISKAITPSSAANMIDVETQIMIGCSALDNVSMALFQDSTANALTGVIGITRAASDPSLMNLFWRLIAGTTSQTTFKVRAGPSGANTITFNGWASARKFGGVMNSYLKIAEVMG